MPKIEIEDRIGLEQMLVKQLLGQGNETSGLRRTMPIEYALNLLSDDRYTDDIAISIIAVERSTFSTVASLANEIAQAFLFMSQNKRAPGLTEDFSDSQQEKAYDVFDVYSKTKQARTKDALFGKILSLEYGVHRPEQIAEAIINVFGGEINTFGDGVMVVENLPWGSLKLVKIDDDLKCSGSAITFGTKMNMDVVFDNLRLLGVNPVKQWEAKWARDIICSSVTVEYSNDLFDRLYFRIVSVP